MFIYNYIVSSNCKDRQGALPEFTFSLLMVVMVNTLLVLGPVQGYLMIEVIQLYGDEILVGSVQVLFNSMLS